MAAKRKRRTAVARSTTKIIKAPAPIIRVAAPRAAPVRRRVHRRRSSGGSSGAIAGLISSEAVQMLIGGALYGYAVKSGVVAKLPAIPIVGRTGTAAIILDYWGRHGGGKYVRTAAHAAASIAGYQLGSEGKIQGDLMTTGDFAMGTADDASTPGSMAGDDGYGD